MVHIFEPTTNRFACGVTLAEVDRMVLAAGLPPPLEGAWSTGDSFARDPALATCSGCLIARECDDLKAMLLEKNKAYGDSALAPVRIFSKASPVEQLLVRLDDKLSRLSRGAAAGEDVERDLAGYLVLLRVARRRTK